MAGNQADCSRFVQMPFGLPRKPAIRGGCDGLPVAKSNV